MNANCFYCGLDHADTAHPTCDRPGCDTQVHGYGTDGKKTTSYCEGCK